MTTDGPERNFGVYKDDHSFQIPLFPSDLLIINVWIFILSTEYVF